VFSNNRNLPRVDRVDFSLNVGTVVPTRVRVAEVPSVLIEFHPEWRNHSYFVVEDEIVIVDRGRRVVGVVPVGSSNVRGSRGGSGGSASVTIDNLGPNEIREVQMVLIREGFSIESDGRLGPRTRDALMQFQRRNGLEVTGQIDSRTITSLGVNINTGSGSSTTGQGGRGSGGGDENPRGGNDQSPGAGNANPDNQSPRGSGNNQPGNPNSTTGQGGPRDNSNTNAPGGSNNMRNNSSGSNPSGSGPNPSGSNPSGSNPSGSTTPGAGGNRREPGSGGAGGAR
jgi:hypothetical protein